MSRRVNIFIDGGNFHYLALKKIGVNDLSFDFEKFVNLLAQGRQVVPNGKRYYRGSVRENPHDPSTVRAMSKQTELFTRLRSSGWEIKTSKLRIRKELIKVDHRVHGYSDLPPAGKEKDLKKAGINVLVFEKMREKGIDVKLATDVIVGAIDDRYDTAIVVSSDADLCPALDWVRKKRGKQIEYVGFSILDPSLAKDNSSPLPTMIKYSDTQRIFTAADLQSCIIPSTPEVPPG